MAEIQEVSMARFEAARKKPAPLGATAKEALEILTNLKVGKPIVVPDASRGLRVSLSRRIKSQNLNVDQRIEQEGKRMNVLLLKRR